MTQFANTFDHYDVGATGAGANREDLSDMIYNVALTKTPVLSAIKKKKATATLHEYLTDTIVAGADNKHLEGDDNEDGTSLTAPSRLSNYTQILGYKPVISGTQMANNTAGIQDQMDYEVAKLMKRIKLDWEWAALDGGGTGGIGRIKAVGNASTERVMGSIQTYLATNVSVGATGSAAAGNSADTMTAGTKRDLTESILRNTMQTAYTNGAEPTMLVVSPTNKGVVSGFSGGGTRYVDTEDKKLVNSIDVYVGDFATLKVVTDVQMANEIVLGLDPEYLAVADLRGLFTVDLGKNGDNYKKLMRWETTLEVCNEKAHFIISDTNG